MKGEPSIDMSMIPPHAAQQAHAAERRHQCHAALDHIFDHRQVAALRIGVVHVQIAAKDQPALVRLAAIEVAGTVR